MESSEFYLLRNWEHLGFWFISEESFFELFLLPKPIFTTGDSFLKLNHLVGDYLAFLKGLSFGDEFIKGHASAVKGLLYLPTSAYGLLDVVSDGLRNFVLVLFCDFNQSVQLAQVDSGLYRILDCTNPSLKLFLLGTLESFQMVRNPPGHLGVAQAQRVMALVVVVVQVVREQYEELGLDVIISHLMKELHRLCSSPVS